MEDVELERVLRTILNQLRTKHFPWRLDGSANLRVQGLSTAVNDLDLATNNDGLRLFKSCLEQYPLQEGFNEKTKAKFLLATIGKVMVEINCYDDFSLRLFDKIAFVNWKGLSLPCLPLLEAREFYRRIHRLEKVELIQKHLDERAGKIRKT